MVTVPTCEAVGHWKRAKSETSQGGTALGLPKTPSGRLTATLSAASGSPGSARVKLALRSGCAPAAVEDVVTPNEVIGSVAEARWATAAIASRRSARIAAILDG